jgi:hypothetical protein
MLVLMLLGEDLVHRHDQRCAADSGAENASAVHRIPPIISSHEMAVTVSGWRQRCAPLPRPPPTCVSDE